MAQRHDQLTELRQTLETRERELTYEEACREVKAVCNAEKARSLRLQILFLEDENNELQSRLFENGDRICDLEKRNHGFQEDLYSISNDFENAQSDTRLKSREIETLKAELNSLHGVTMDSTKLLTEKLTLARELSSLRPELDHLRSQAGSYQLLLAEKLSLQRHLNTIQVELETEKRSTQRFLAKESKSNAEDAKWGPQIELLQAELTRERRDRQKSEREAQKASMESDNKKITLESRLDAFRTKLRSTKEQLKATHLALETAQKRPVDTARSSAQHSRKRAAVQANADSMIGTPGDLPAAKRGRRGSSLVGEKSTFSITPFLNRAASTAPGSPSARKSDSDGEVDVDSRKLVSRNENVEQRFDSTIRDLHQGGGVAGVKKPGNLGKAKPSQANSKAPPVRKVKAAQTLEQVVEEIADENNGTDIGSPRDLAVNDILDERINETIEMRKKNRKLLGRGFGKTLFDEEEGDVFKGDTGLLGGTTSLGGPATDQFRGPRFGRRRALETGMGSFGNFSPLKRDKKGAL